MDEPFGKPDSLAGNEMGIFRIRERLRANDMKEFVTIKDLKEDERPYEKCLKEGPKALTDVQLLAAILRTGSQGENSLELAERVLALDKTHAGILGLIHLSVAQLMSVKGIGRVKAIQIQCVGELSRRIWKTIAKDNLLMTSPKTIANYYMEDLRHKNQEEMRLILLNTKNKFIGDVVLTKGTVNASLISPREVFIEALKYEAVYVILLHNHPSGDPTPSKEDLLVTKKMMEAGKLLDIQVIDHIIIGDNLYISLRERGIM